MKQVFIAREGDKNRFSDYENHFIGLRDKELIETYHQQVRCGITGVHAQAINLLALRKVMKERFGDSPITFEDGRVISLTDFHNSQD